MTDTLLRICLVAFPGLARSHLTDLEEALSGDHPLHKALIDKTATPHQAEIALQIRTLTSTPIRCSQHRDVTPTQEGWSAGEKLDLLILCAGPNATLYLPMGLRGFLRDADRAGATLAGLGNGGLVLKHLNYLNQGAPCHADDSQDGVLCEDGRLIATDTATCHMLAQWGDLYAAQRREPAKEEHLQEHVATTDLSDLTPDIPDAGSSEMDIGLEDPAESTAVDHRSAKGADPKIAPSLHLELDGTNVATHVGTQNTNAPDSSPAPTMAKETVPNTDVLEGDAIGELEPNARPCEALSENASLGKNTPPDDAPLNADDVASQAEIGTDTAPSLDLPPQSSLPSDVLAHAVSPRPTQNASLEHCQEIVKSKNNAEEDTPMPLSSPEELYAPRPHARSIGDPVLSQMRAVMTEHLDEPVPLTVIAQQMGLSPKQLRLRCKKVLGTTPAQAYLELRLDHARELVNATAMSVADIARCTGFASPSAFTRSYRRTFGQSPREARAL